ncbi:Hypothetical_protein [Hexamita inflata]|uniref:Hypothetical_protein n=1 Tax=Hexamita inflata TaxID=28002 RepID=A0ABP1H735_9EUKA
MIDNQNDYKFNRQSTIDNHADVEWKYRFYQKQWSEEDEVYIQFLVFISLTRTRSDRRRWLALVCLYSVVTVEFLPKLLSFLLAFDYFKSFEEDLDYHSSF